LNRGKFERVRGKLGDMSMEDFTDKVVVVTGGTGNLGSSVVRAFQASGARLVVPDRNYGRAGEMFPELAGSMDHLLMDGIDVTDPEPMQRCVQSAADQFGRIDILVNTVGGYRQGAPVHETQVETWDFLLNLNARSVFVSSRAVIPVMLRSGGGRIVNIGSFAALAGRSGEGVYSAAKSAVLRLTESMAADYASQNIQVNAVLPAALVSDADLRADPTRGVTPEAVAQVVLFLCSEAGRIISGASIPAFGRRFSS
jgi:NAD(P)-dependent dehydrogenase (short-subunit alcohol dehydrogenase family)